MGPTMSTDRRTIPHTKQAGWSINNMALNVAAPSPRARFYAEVAPSSVPDLTCLSPLPHRGPHSRGMWNAGGRAQKSQKITRTEKWDLKRGTPQLMKPWLRPQKFQHLSTDLCFFPTWINLIHIDSEIKFSLQTGVKVEEGRLHLRNLQFLQEVTEAEGIQSRNKTPAGPRKITAMLTKVAWWK